MADKHEVLEGVKEYTRELLGTTFIKAAEASASRSESAAREAVAAAEQVADLCRTYRDGGGDPAVLEKAVTGEGVDDDRA